MGAIALVTTRYENADKTRGYAEITSAYCRMPDYGVEPVKKGVAPQGSISLGKKTALEECRPLIGF